MSEPLERPLIIKDIFGIVARQHELSWQPFREDVEIHWLYEDGDHGAAAALLRFKPGGKVPLHQHVGFEHIIVLSGSQTDQNGHLPTGSLMIHPPGTSHSITSEEGCIALAIYEKRVSFINEAEAEAGER